jgi:hypothetical protein
MAVAGLLIALGVSPVTAPFSTFSFDSFTQHDAAFKTTHPLKNGEQSVVEVSSADGRSEPVPLTECLARFVGIAVDWEPTWSAVLRV